MYACYFLTWQTLGTNACAPEMPTVVLNMTPSTKLRQYTTETDVKFI